MLQRSLMFLRTADENNTEEFEFSSIKASGLSNFSTVVPICIPVCILGLIGNGIIFWLLCCTIKKAKFTIYAANLAAGDFLALLGILISFLEYLTPRYFGTFTKQANLLLLVFGHGTNSYFLAAMSTERYLTVFSPIWYQSNQEKHSTQIVCAFLWTLAVTLSMLTHFLCTPRYISAFNISTLPCRVLTIVDTIINYIIIFPSMVFSSLALCIRMIGKPQQDFPARLDISIWVTVVLHFIFYPVPDIIIVIFQYIPFHYHLEFHFLTLIFYCIGSAVDPFVYLLVGCWKREKGQEPFYMFLERALKDERKGMRRTEADLEQA